MPSSSSHPWKYDVFVSFRGRDVRRKFISHLFHRLKRDGFHYFSDNDKDNIGEKIRVKLFRAIRYARFALVLFSVNYADSKWCLDELVQILKCRRKRKKQGHVVIPVFFRGVDASEVSKLTSGTEFGRGFKRLCGKAIDKEQIRKWKRALAKAKHISGFDLQNDANGNEAQLIDIIIESLHKKFRQHAIETEPTQGCEEGYTRGIHCAGRHPLALKRFDFCLSDKSADRRPKILESVGPSGGRGGSAYDDGTYAGGRKITVRVNPVINSVTFDYDRDGFFLCSLEQGRHPDSKNFLAKSIKAPVDYCDMCDMSRSGMLDGSFNASIWDDGNGDCTNVRKIILEFARSKRFIGSTTFHYEVKTKRSWQQERRLGILGEVAESHMIRTQYLPLFSGHCMDDGMTSLKFETNKRKVELIFREGEVHFSSHTRDDKIVRFYGRSDENLDVIGAYFELISDLYLVKLIGLIGIPGCVWDHGKFKGVRKIKVKHNIYIYYIKFMYDDGSDQGCLVTDEGCTKGDCPMVTTVTLDYPWEYLTSISGYMRDYAIQSLTFYSNKGRYGPFGKEIGEYFWYPLNGSRITGLNGTGDPDNGILKSRGVYVEPIPRMYPFKTVGLFGGSVGTQWDDGVHTNGRGFRISFTEAIEAIAITYDNNLSVWQGFKHGTEGNDFYEVSFSERIRRIDICLYKDGKTVHPNIHDLKIFTKGNQSFRIIGISKMSDAISYPIARE